MKVQILKIYLHVLHHFVIQRNKYLGVSITEEIVSSVLLAVASYLHAGSAMIKSVTIQWIGIFVPYIIVCLIINGLYVLFFNIKLFAGRLQLK